MKKWTRLGWSCKLDSWAGRVCRMPVDLWVKVLRQINVAQAWRSGRLWFQLALHRDAWRDHGEAFALQGDKSANCTFNCNNKNLKSFLEYIFSIKLSRHLLLPKEQSRIAQRGDAWHKLLSTAGVPMDNQSDD